jgi:hypothetical protein
LAAVGEKRSTNRFGLLAARHRQVLATGRLLIRALAIEADLWRRLAKQPKNKVLLSHQKEYQRLVGQLVWEHKIALNEYLAIIRRLIRR